MLTGYWSEATARPIPNTASPHPGEGKWLHEVAGKFTKAPLGWVLHVVVGNGSPFETFHRAVSPSRRFSTLWVAKDGRTEEFAPLDYKSWAQGEGNGLYWSVETEGFPTEALTDAQIHTLAKWHVFTGTADHVAATPGEKGIITHSAGGAAWGGHTCPDPAPGAGPRSKQRAAIIAAAVELRGNKPKPAIAVHGPVGYGDTDANTKGSVTAIQHRLDRQLGVKVAIDGDYGRRTMVEVQAWQRKHNLVQDGVVGARTAASMGLTYAARA